MKSIHTFNHKKSFTFWIITNINIITRVKNYRKNLENPASFSFLILYFYTFKKPPKKSTTPKVQSSLLKVSFKKALLYQIFLNLSSNSDLLQIDWYLLSKACYGDTHKELHSHHMALSFWIKEIILNFLNLILKFHFILHCVEILYTILIVYLFFAYIF